MLRYKTKARPGLVALYDIRPGNGAGPFLQPRSPHGATGIREPTFKEMKGSDASCPVWRQRYTVAGPVV